MQIYSSVSYDPTVAAKVSSNIFDNEHQVYFDTPIDEFGEEKEAANEVEPIAISEALKVARQLDWEERIRIKQADDLHHDNCMAYARHVGQIRESIATASPGQRRQWAESVVAWRGKEACDVLSLVVDSPVEELEKAASTDERVFFRRDIPAVVAMDNLVAEACQIKQLHYKLAQAQHDHLMNSMERYDLISKLGFDLSKFNPVELSAKPYIGNLPEGENPSIAAQQGALDTLIDPDVISQSNSIDQALAMKQLLSEDEVISQGHAPEEVQRALEELNVLAPEAGRYTPMLRAMLRRRLEMGQSLEDYELDKLLDLNEKVIKREVPTSTPAV
jgi:hypothetical protein